MNSENSKTFDLYRLLINLINQSINQSIKYVDLSNLSICYTG